MTVSELLREYDSCRSEIQDRLSEFKEVGHWDDRAIFKELCFCILAANSSAEMGMRTVSAVEDLLWEGSLQEMQDRLAGKVRFWRVRPAYIVSTREFLKEVCGLRIKTFLQSFAGADQRRDYLAQTRGIYGIGFKEASHFLRNIGFKGYAIIDKHILSCLKELKVIGLKMAPTNRRRYRLIERRMKRLSSNIGIGLDELDLLLWRHKTGKILK